PASTRPPADQPRVAPAITYQGELLRDGRPAAAPVDLRFRLYTDPIAGDPVGPQLELLSAQLDPNGRFSVELDFGPDAFNEEVRWLEIDVAEPGGPFTTLAP